MSRKGCLWFAGGLLLAGIAGVLAFVTVLQAARARQAVPEAPTVQVLVATRDLPLHTVVAAGDVTLREVAPEMVPEDALTDPEEAVGQMVVVDIVRDEVILRRRLLEPDYLGPNVALVMDPERVVIAFPIFDLLSTLDILRPGDRVDLVFTIVPSTMDSELSSAKITLTVMSDVVVAAVVRAGDGQEGGAPQALLLAFEPQDALTVKFFQDIGAAVDLLLRSPAAAEGPFETVPVDADYVLQRFRLGVRR